MTTRPAISEQKRTYLDILAILHYVHAGVIGLAALVALGAVGFFAASSQGHPRGLGPSELAILAPIMFLVIAYAAANFLVGYWLRQRRGWLAIIVISALNALNVPLGTLLGVFTVVVLAGEEVRAVFEGRTPPPAVAPATPAG